jgi:hypothetical protein
MLKRRIMRFEQRSVFTTLEDRRKAALADRQGVTLYIRSGARDLGLYVDHVFAGIAGSGDSADDARMGIDVQPFGIEVSTARHFDFE